MTDFLETLQNKLSSEWNPHLHPAQGAGSFPRLVQPLGPMELIIVQLSAAQRATGNVPQRDDVDRLQMYVQLPFNIDKNYLGETARLLSALNGRLPLLGFIIGADGKTIAFRYLHLFDPQQPGWPLIEEAMTQIKFAVANFTPVIHTVSNGSASYEQIIQDMDRNQ